MGEAECVAKTRHTSHTDRIFKKRSIQTLLRSLLGISSVQVIFVIVDQQKTITLAVSQRNFWNIMQVTK